MNIAELEAFLAVYHHGNYTRAATTLRISQPAISRRISLLESDLGSVLFERGRHGARPTPAAGVFAVFAERALAELLAGKRAVEDVQAGEAGRISLAIAGTIPNTSILDNLREFRNTNPSVQLHLVTGTSDEVSRLVASGEADIGLRYFPDQDPVLESISVASEDAGIYASSHSNLIDAHHVTAESLSACPWIMFPVGEGSSGEPFAVKAMEALNSAGIHPRHLVRVDGLSAQKRLVASDFGLALMQHSAMADELAAGAVQQIGAGLVTVSFPIYLILRKSRYESMPRTRLIEILMQPGADSP